MPEKRCVTCHEVRPLSAFNRRRAAADGLQARCRDCSRAWYAANAVTHKERTRRRSDAVRREYQQRLGAYLADHPCVDCGERDVRVLEFDHEDPGQKLAEVMRLVASGVAWQRVETEIAKCSVRCANCHRRITSERAQDWRARFVAGHRSRDAAAALARLERVLG